MLVLALDSTETTGTAAICEDGKLVGQTTLNASLTHSETLLPVIASLLENCRKSVADVDLFSCSVGPGSFTGVRIGVSTIKGLAFDSGKPCIGVSSLEALAYNFVGFDGVVCPVMDARRSQVYNAMFRIENSKVLRLTKDRMISLDELSEELKNFDKDTVYVCGGATTFLSEKYSGANVKFAEELLRYESGFSVALAAYCRYKDGLGDVLNDSELVPTYLRPSQAERMLNGKE